MRFARGDVRDHIISAVGHNLGSTAAGHFARFEEFFAFSGLEEFNRDRRSDITNALVGTWKLVEFYIEFDDSHERAERLGANPVGYLVFTEERLITLMTGHERTIDATAGELLDSMVAYSGRYRLQGDDCFITTVDSAWQPAWLGTEQVRFFKMDGEMLSVTSALREEPKYPGRRFRGVAIWRKD